MNPRLETPAYVAVYQQGPTWTEIASLRSASDKLPAGYNYPTIEKLGAAIRTTMENCKTPLMFCATVSASPYSQGQYENTEKWLAKVGWVNIRVAQNWSSGHQGDSTIRIWMYKTGKKEDPTLTFMNPYGHKVPQVLGGCGWRYWEGTQELYCNKKASYYSAWDARSCRELRMFAIPVDYKLTDLERKHMLELNYRRIATLEKTKLYLNGWKPKEWPSKAIEVEHWSKFKCTTLCQEKMPKPVYENVFYPAAQNIAPVQVVINPAPKAA